MGLCKCPKRKVTNLFCFEHRVNVCEYCLIENHPRCIVQSYLNWLKDSDYDPNCALCNITLTEGEVIRLLCYDVFHVSCLEKHYRVLPSNTAPAGYRCYSCDSPVFPAQNQAGHVTDNLRKVLSNYNWARVGLCLPLIDEPNLITKLDDDTTNLIEDQDNDSLHGSIISPSTTHPNESLSRTNDSSSSQNSLTNTYQSHSEIWEPKVQNSRPKYQPQSETKPHTVLTVDDYNPVNYDATAVSRKMLGATSNPALKGISLSDDADGVDKYKRRSALSWLRRWLKSRMLRGRGYHDNRALPRKVVVLLLIGLVALLTFIVFATKVARRPGDNDPNFDPLLNPNIHVARAIPALKDGGWHGNENKLDPLQAVQPAAGGR